MAYDHPDQVAHTVVQDRANGKWYRLEAQGGAIGWNKLASRSRPQDLHYVAGSEPVLAFPVSVGRDSWIRLELSSGVLTLRQLTPTDGGYGVRFRPLLAVDDSTGKIYEVKWMPCGFGIADTGL